MLGEGPIVVTGASSGIGAAVAEALAGAGRQVALVSRSASRLGDVVARLPAVEAGPHLSIGCDVTDRREVSAAIARIEELGTPTGLVNAAGVCVPARLDLLTAENWHTTLETNLTGAFLMSQAIGLAMVAADVVGSIVNIGSEASLLGMPGYVAYCASKAGLVGLTRAMAAELAPRVRVNLLCPGPVDTPMLRAEVATAPDPDRAWAAERARVPLGRIASAQEIAAAVLWLLISATFATGTTLALDGGTTGAPYGARLA